MLRKISAAVLVGLIVFTFAPVQARAATEPAPLNAKGVVLMEQTSRRVLYSQNAHEKMPMASTTKVMTALVALEQTPDLETIVTTPAEAYGIEGSSMYLGNGERITMHNLLYGLMLNSGNDAAVAVAVHVAGSVPEFAALMNQKAKELGAQNTNFINPHGLPADNHYTTAFDFALICAAAMENQTFREIVATREISIPWEGRTYDRVLKSHNRIFALMDDANGIKTGYTKASGRCLCGAALRDGMQLVSVVLNDQNYFQETADLLNWGFSEYANYTLLEKDDMIGLVEIQEGFINSMELRSEADVKVALRRDEIGRVEKRTSYPKSVLAPVRAGQKAGTIQFLLNGEVIAEQDLVYPDSALRDSYALHLRRAIWGYLNAEPEVTLP